MVNTGELKLINFYYRFNLLIILVVKAEKQLYKFLVINCLEIINSLEIKDSNT